MSQLNTFSIWHLHIEFQHQQIIAAFILRHWCTCLKQMMSLRRTCSNNCLSDWVSLAVNCWIERKSTSKCLSSSVKSTRIYDIKTCCWSHTNKVVNMKYYQFMAVSTNHSNVSPISPYHITSLRQHDVYLTICISAVFFNKQVSKHSSTDAYCTYYLCHVYLLFPQFPCSVKSNHFGAILFTLCTRVEINNPCRAQEQTKSNS